MLIGTHFDLLKLCRRQDFYPRPIVDPAKGRTLALEAYEAMKKAAKKGAKQEK